MKKPKVTVVITVKNGARTIEACVSSVLENRIPKKVLVIDAFSDDGTYELLKKFEREGKIKLVRMKSNAPEAFNYGIKKTDTEIVALTDADCVVDEEWLEKLVKGINGKYVAAAGYCTSPKGLKGLARAFGYTFDERFDIDANEVQRAPTMNLAFRKDVAEKVLFDESLPIAFETDFCFRLLEHGKIRYVKDAVVYHYHRATWKGFFRQQKNYGKYAVLVYLRHLGKLGGDHVSRRRFFVQVLMLYLVAGLGVLGLWWKPALMGALVGTGIIFTLWSYEVLRSRPENAGIFMVMMAVRLVAWCVGGVEGIIHSVKERFQKYIRFHQKI